VEEGGGRGGKGGRCVGLTTLPPSCADCLEIWEPQSPATLRAFSRPVMGLLYFFSTFLFVLIIIILNVDSNSEVSRTHVRNAHHHTVCILPVVTPLNAATACVAGTNSGFICGLYKLTPSFWFATVIHSISCNPTG